MCELQTLLQTVILKNFITFQVVRNCTQTHNDDIDTPDPKIMAAQKKFAKMVIYILIYFKTNTLKIKKQ